MKLEKAYPTTILTWHHEPFEKFMGENKNHISYEIGISRPDIFNSCFDFYVKTNKVYVNEFNGTVFEAKTESVFQIKYHEDVLTIDFLFDLVNKATFNFAVIFHEKTQKTNLLHHKTPIPQIDDLREPLKQIIDTWDAPAKKFKEKGGERLAKFKNLPEIPEHKRYNDNHASTLEQRISNKFQMNHYVSDKERKVFNELSHFYKELNEQLDILDYKSFNGRDFLDFKNYIQFAFNTQILITNQLSIEHRLYRLVINESVSKKNEPLTDTNFLTYPPLDIVKDLGKYNRASTWQSTLLYLTENVDTALKELQPPLNKLVTVGVWDKKNDKTFTSYPITHNSDAAKVHPETLQGHRAIRNVEKLHDPLFSRYLSNYLNLLAREYSKRVSHHYEYLLSALLSENIFNIEDPNPDFDYDCIVYPSVGNNFLTRNIAVKPDVADEDFILVKVIQFELESSDYSKTPIYTGSPEHISIAKVKHWRETSNITKDGNIIWQ